MNDSFADGGKHLRACLLTRYIVIYSLGRWPYEDVAPWGHFLVTAFMPACMHGVDKKLTGWGKSMRKTT